MQNFIVNVWAWLKGKKTYFVGLGIIAVALAFWRGLVNQQTAIDLIGFLMGGGVLSIRSAISDSHNAQLAAIEGAVDQINAQAKPAA